LVGGKFGEGKTFPGPPKLSLGREGISGQQGGRSGARFKKRVFLKFKKGGWKRPKKGRETQKETL